MASYPLNLQWFITIIKSLSQIMNYYIRFSVHCMLNIFETIRLSQCSISPCGVLYFVGHHATGQRGFPKSEVPASQLLQQNHPRVSTEDGGRSPPVPTRGVQGHGQTGEEKRYIEFSNLINPLWTSMKICYNENDVIKDI